jgi:lysophospholipase L1-like esterase
MSRPVLLALALSLSAGCDYFKNPSEPAPTPLPTPTGVHYTAIGASDAIGYGASIPCLPFSPCPAGTGYVQTLARQLEGGGQTVTLMNLGIPAAVLGPDTQALGTSLGRDIFGNFLEREVPFVPRDTTVVTVFAGGNDVNTVGAALDAGRGGTNPTAYMQTQTQGFSRDLQLLLTGIRDRAPQARIVAINVPNMAALPYASGYTLAQKKGLQQIAVAFSAQINALAVQSVIVIDLMCDAQMYQGNMYSSDGFHPNDTGYARLAALTLAAAKNGTATTPKASCSQMTIY